MQTDLRQHKITPLAKMGKHCSSIGMGAFDEPVPNQTQQGT